MQIKILPADKMPNRAAKSGVCQTMPEWKEILEAIGRLSPGEGFVVVLSEASLSKIGGNKKHRHSYVATQLKVHFKNFQIPAEAWTNHDRLCIQRLPK